jgi:ferric-dicitrate binding protein FerR (iron transport regulator)
MKLAISRALPSPSRRRRTWWLAGGAAVACSALLGWNVGGHARGGAGEAHATLVKIVHGGADTGTGVVAVGKDGHRAELAEGSRIAWGTRLETSPGTRARLELDDGTAVALDRATALVLEAAQTLQLPSGAIVADVGGGRVARGLDGARRGPRGRRPFRDDRRRGARQRGSRPR